MWGGISWFCIAFLWQLVMLGIFCNKKFLKNYNNSLLPTMSEEYLFFLILWLLVNVSNFSYALWVCSSWNCPFCVYPFLVNLQEFMHTKSSIKFSVLCTAHFSQSIVFQLTLNVNLFFHTQIFNVWRGKQLPFLL